MATTIPTEFKGCPFLSAEKIEFLKEWYKQSLVDMDKSTDPVDTTAYTATAYTLEAVLRTLYDMDIPTYEEHKSQPLQRI